MTQENWNRKYDGAAFDHQFEKGRATGTIEIDHDAITFSSSSGQIEFPLNSVYIKAGGASERLIFFSHPGFPDSSIYTSDHTILNNPILLSNQHVQSHIASIRTQKNYGKLITVGVILFFALLIYSLFLLKDPVVNAIAQQIPPSWEKQLGEVVYNQSVTGKRLIEEKQVVVEFKNLTSPLVRAIDSDRYEFTFHIIEEPTLNAFAIPGGHIVIHSGLILKSDSPEEILGVLSHEIAHVTKQHSLKQMISSTGVVLIAQALLGDMEGILALITQKSTFLLMQKFSREHEQEADDAGFAYLIKAHINPEGMITFFKKLQKENNSMQALNETLNFLSTHPTAADRFESLKNKLEHSQKKTDYIHFNIDFNGFKNQIRESLKEKEKV